MTMQWTKVGKGIKVYCKMLCGDTQGGRHLYKNHYWCKHCSCAVSKSTRCFCCGQKLRHKSHFYKRKIQPSLVKRY